MRGLENMRTVVEQQIAMVRQIAAEYPDAKLTIATYDREEFAELRRGEDYDRFKRQERQFLEGLARAGLMDRIFLQPIDAAGYWRFLAQHPEFEEDEASRSAYAAELAHHKKAD